VPSRFSGVIYAARSMTCRFVL
jgi:lipoprotein NlpI